MKQKILSLAIIAASLNTASALAGDPKVYGKANLSLNKYDNDGEDSVKVNSNASRFGVKGSIDATDSVKAIYKFEYETFIDDGDDGEENNSEFKQRNIYAGFQGDFGTIIAGNHDTPTKLAQGKIDRFNDLDKGDIKNVVQGENRVSNIVMYSTPKFNGLSATVAFASGEKEDGANDGISTAVSYKADNYSFTLAYDNDSSLDTNSKDGTYESLTRFVAEFKGDNYKFGALLQTADEGTADDEAYVLSGEYKLSKQLVLKAQYAHSDDDTTEKTQTAFGTDYKLNKKSKIYAYYSNIEQTSKADDSTFAVGYEIKF
ncbi:porin [Pseudomonadales bacterium]|nr:porin [Pseudomonadales bacterium]